MALMFNNASHKLQQAALDALWTKQKVISDNIANYETPDYKAKTVNFEQTLGEFIKNDGNNETITATIQIDERDNDTIRMDGNNVDMEQEQLELWKTYAQYNYLTDKISGDFKNLRYVINQLGK